MCIISWKVLQTLNFLIDGDDRVSDEFRYTIHKNLMQCWADCRVRFKLCMEADFIINCTYWSTKVMSCDYLCRTSSQQAHPVIINVPSTRTHLILSNVQWLSRFVRTRASKLQQDSFFSHNKHTISCILFITRKEYLFDWENTGLDLRSGFTCRCQ